MNGSLRAIARSMTSTTHLFAALCLTAGITACGSSATDIGDVTVDGVSYHIAREGAEPAAGVSTQMVIKPNDGSKPDMVAGWVGLATDSAMAVPAKYDPNDGDFDDDITVQSPLPAGSMFYFVVTKTGVATTGMIAFK
jgi:hypothetical protein